MIINSDNITMNHSKALPIVVLCYWIYKLCCN